MPSPDESQGNRLIGDDLLETAVADPPRAQALAEHLRATGDWREVVAGVDSVVVQFDNASIDTELAAERFATAIAQAPDAIELPDSRLEIPVCYGGEFGPDLDDVCARLGLSPAEFIGRHTATEYRVDMLGFTPGFAYIGGLDDSLAVPRRPTPRQFVPAGSVGIAANRTGLYALPGPGGWSIVGRTPAALFDTDAESPVLLAPGMRVRFRELQPADFDGAADA